MEKHITLVGTLNIVYSALTVLGAGILFVLGGWFGQFFESLMRDGYLRPHEVPIEVLDIVPVVLFLIGLMMLIVALGGIIGGLGVLNKKEWARILLLVISFFTLVRIPLGTILGVYSIWTLLNDETIRLFEGGTSPTAATMQPDERRMA